jgi:hypothetical protein
MKAQPPMDTDEHRWGWGKADERRAGLGLPNVVEKVLLGHCGVAESPPQRMPIYFVVVGKDDPPPVRVLQLHMAAFAVYLQKTQSSQRGEDLSAGQDRQFHVSSTNSARSSWGSCAGAGSR